MKPTALAEAIPTGDGPVVIDVRSRMEYNFGHIPGAEHIPFWSVFFRYKELEGRKDRRLVLTCEHGPRAWISKAILVWRGFKNVILLDGHMKAWKKAGLELKKS